MQPKQNPPNKHHFIPAFLLKQWADANQEFWRYFRRKGEGGVEVIDCKPATPGSVCYRPGLYKTEGLPPEHAQQVETLFMTPLDTKAAEVHALLLDGGVGALSDAQRCQWAGIYWSLSFRTPREVAGLRDAVAALLEPAVGKAVLGLDEPIDFPPGTADQLAMELLMRSIDHEERGGALIELEWDVIDIPNREFFISDWPIDEFDGTARLGRDAWWTSMPIAPRKLFVAAPSRTVIAALRRMPERGLVIRQNQASVRQAGEFVGATNRHAEQFIKANFGQRERPSLTANIGDRFRARAAKD